MDDPSRDPAANDPATTWPRSGARSTYEKSLGQDDLSRQEAWATRAQAGSGLKRALRRARLDEAERTEVIADLRGAEIARLEMLQEELAPLLSEVPETIDLFDVAIMPGARPRLFIDMIGFVELAHDRRTYRFVQDTRHGRTALAESADIDEMIDAIADYMAHRLIEREKALASDVRSDRAGRLRRSVKGERPAKKPRDSADLEASQFTRGAWGGRLFPHDFGHSFVFDRGFGLGRVLFVAFDGWLLPVEERRRLERLALDFGGAKLHTAA